MAGPTCVLLLMESLSGDNVIDLRNHIYGIAEKVEDRGGWSWNFWIRDDLQYVSNKEAPSRPFSIHVFREEAEDFLNDYSREEIMLLEQTNWSQSQRADWYICRVQW